VSLVYVSIHAVTLAVSADEEAGDLRTIQALCNEKQARVAPLGSLASFWVEVEEQTYT